MTCVKKIILTVFLSICTASIAYAVNSGLFFVSNDTDHTVTIGVGNFFPTKYTISPHNSTSVYVSSDNQNIHIYSVS